MKILFVSVACMVMNIAVAQKGVTDASFKYDIAIESAGDAPVAKSFEGASLQVFVRGGLSRTDMVSGLGTETTFYDTKTGKGTILKEYSGQKLMITLTKENWLHKNRLFQNLKFTTGDVTKTINGFACKKATASIHDGEQFVVYYSTDITLANTQYNNAFAGLAGLPVQYEIKSGNLRFTYTLKSISYDVVPTAKFELPRTGYRTMSYEETQQLKKGNR